MNGRILQSIDEYTYECEMEDHRIFTIEIPGYSQCAEDIPFTLHSNQFFARSAIHIEGAGFLDAYVQSED